MGVNSKIEWTDDTWNFIVGCTRVSSGCAHCYAIRDVHRMAGNPNPKISGPRQGLVEEQANGVLDWTGKVSLLESRLWIPLSKQQPTRYFVNSLSDLFHEEVPDRLIAAAFGVMAWTPRHTFQVLTKRPERMARFLADLDAKKCVEVLVEAMPLDVVGRTNRDQLRAAYTRSWPLRNVWLGTSVENQKAADERIPHLKAAPGWIKFLSCEPLLGPLDLSAHLSCCPSCGYPRSENWSCGYCDAYPDARPISWVIVGGESGPGARPMHPRWAQQLRDQCAAAGVAYFFKQWGDWLPWEQRSPETKPPADGPGKGWPMGFITLDGRSPDPISLDPDQVGIVRAGKKAAGRLLDGRTWDEMPAVAVPG